MRTNNFTVSDERSQDKNNGKDKGKDRNQEDEGKGTHKRNQK